MSLSLAPLAEAVCTNSASAASTQVLVRLVRASASRLERALRRLEDVRLEVVSAAGWTATATGRPIRAHTRAAIAASAGPNRNGKTLSNATGRLLSWTLAWKPAVVGGEVSGDHPGFHGDAFFRQLHGFVRHVGAVFAVVDAGGAKVTVAAGMRFVLRFVPGTAMAETWDRRQACQICGWMRRK